MEQENHNKSMPNLQDLTGNFGNQPGDMMSMLLPLLSGGGVSQEAIFKMLAQNNPRLGGIMQLLPMLSKPKSAPTHPSFQNQNFVKISDYYKK